MRVLIIGGTRFIGPRVVRALVNREHDVTVIHRGQTQTSLPPSVRVLNKDRRDLSTMASEIARLAPDVVLDMICLTEQDAQQLVAAFRGSAGRIVMISSMDVYGAYGRLTRIEAGEPDTRPFGEQSQLRTMLYPYRAHAKSEEEALYRYEKILAERVVMAQQGLPTTVLRLPAVYGPGDHRCFEHLKRMRDGRMQIILGQAQAQWRWTRGYVENVADAIALAATDERAAGRVYNVGEADALTEADWVREIGAAAGWQGRIISLADESLPDHLKMPFDFRHHLFGDTSRVRTDLGYSERVSRSEAIKQTVDWETDNTPAEFDPARFNYSAEDAVLAGLLGE